MQLQSSSGLTAPIACRDNVNADQTAAVHGYDGPIPNEGAEAKFACGREIQHEAVSINPDEVTCAASVWEASFSCSLRAKIPGRNL